MKHINKKDEIYFKIKNILFFYNFDLKKKLLCFKIVMCEYLLRIIIKLFRKDNEND